MTNEEAIELIQNVAWLGTDNGTYVYEALEMAIKALERQNKYRWHDLRKDPNDLPSYPITEVIVVFEIGYKERVYRMCWYSTDKKCFADERVFHRKDKAIAWREIEPFEEVKE